MGCCGSRVEVDEEQEAVNFSFLYGPLILIPLLFNSYSILILCSPQKDHAYWTVLDKQMDQTESKIVALFIHNKL
jgi:hypothetical protein